jgi:DNA polymerase II small subunit/DNA polymerase delta subunit B
MKVNIEEVSPVKKKVHVEIPEEDVAKEIDADIRILEDPTSVATTVGSLEEYHEYFSDRFRRLQRCLRQRIDAKDATSITDALRAPLNARVKIIGMLTERRESKQRTFNRGIILINPGSTSEARFWSSFPSIVIASANHTFILSSLSF